MIVLSVRRPVCRLWRVCIHRHSLKLVTFRMYHNSPVSAISQQHRSVCGQALRLCMPLRLNTCSTWDAPSLLPPASCLLPHVRVHLPCSYIYDVGARVHEWYRGAGDGRIRLEQRADVLPC